MNRSKDHLVIADGLIHPDNKEYIQKILKKYPNHFPVLMLPGQLHLAYVNNAKEEISNMSKWREIKNNFQEHTLGETIVVHIDGWKTNNQNEEGSTIAKVIYHEGERETTVEYLDKDAKEDNYAQRMINDAKARLICLHDLKYLALEQDYNNLNNIEKAWLEIEDIQQSLDTLNDRELAFAREDILDKVDFALELLSPIVRDDMSTFDN